MNNVGMMGALHLYAMLSSLSHKRGNFAPCVSPNSFTPLPSSSSLMATTSKPDDACFTRSSSSFGNDFLQGSHHVAQKSTRTTFPFHCERELFPLPLTLSPADSGAGLLSSSCF